MLQNIPQIKSQVDISSLVDFFSMISFCDAVSWGHNQDLFKMPGDRWKWIITDFDRAWTYGGGMGSLGGVTHNPFTSAAGSSPSIVPGDTLFSKLIANSDFKNYFIQRYAAHLNSTLKPSRLTRIVDSIQFQLPVSKCSSGIYYYRIECASLSKCGTLIVD